MPTYSTEVKYWRSDMPRVPTYTTNGTPTLNISELVHNLLVDGFTNIDVLSAEIVDGIATFTVADGDSFGLYSVVNISGISNEPSVNGEHRVINATTTSFQIEVDMPNTLLTSSGGGIKAKYAEVGWLDDKVKVARSCRIKSSNPVSTQTPINIYTQSASTTYVNIGVGASDTLLTYWYGYYTNGTNLPYVCIATDTYFYIFVTYSATNKAVFTDTFGCNFFGDCISLLPPQYGNYKPAVVLGQYSSGNYLSSYALTTRFNTNDGYIAANSIATNGISFINLVVQQGPDTSLISGRGKTPLPDWRNGQLSISPYLVLDNGLITAKVPGLYFIHNNIQNKYNNMSFIKDDVNKKIYLLTHSATNSPSYSMNTDPKNNSACGPVLIDITGPIG